MSHLCLQDPALPSVSVFSDDGAEGHREAGWLAENLHHLHAQRHHRQSGLVHLPALQSRGAVYHRPTTPGALLLLPNMSNLVVTVSFLFLLRLVLQAASSASWLVCLWSCFRAGRSLSGHCELLPSCWPSQPSSFPSVCFLGLTTLRTSVVLCLDFSCPSLFCRTSGKCVC